MSETSSNPVEIRRTVVIALEADAKQAHVATLAREALVAGGWLRPEGLGRSVNRRVTTAIKANLQSAFGGDPIVSYNDNYGMLTVRIWGVVGLDYDHSVDVFLGYDGHEDDGGHYKAGLSAAWFDKSNARHGSAARARIASARAWLATDGPEELAAARAAVVAAEELAKTLTPDHYSV